MEGLRQPRVADKILCVFEKCLEAISWFFLEAGQSQVGNKGFGIGFNSQSTDAIFDTILQVMQGGSRRHAQPKDSGSAGVGKAPSAF